MQPYKVLIVDDDPEVQLSLFDSLEIIGGYTPTSVSGGAEALLLLPNLQPDGILLDQRMPGMSGVEFLSKLDGVYASDDVLPIVYGLTAHGRSEMIEEAARLELRTLTKCSAKPWPEDLLSVDLKDDLLTRRSLIEDGGGVRLPASLDEARAALDRQSRVESLLKAVQSRMRRPDTADRSQLRCLRQSPAAWNAWRSRHPEVRPVLWGADLCNANLTGADLDRAVLIGANLIGTDLRGANLRRADLTGAIFGRTSLLNVDLRRATGLSKAVFKENCTIDLRTIRKSWPMPDLFLKGCGLSDRQIVVARAYAADPEIHII